LGDTWDKTKEKWKNNTTSSAEGQININIPTSFSGTGTVNDTKALEAINS
jgi:hypothetical protein